MVVSPGFLNLVLFVLGLTLFSVGLALIWGPLGLIGAGVVLILGATLGGKSR